MSVVRTMADEKRANRPKGGAAPGDKKPRYTTLRLYAEDGEDLSNLADLQNKTIADFYRETFGKRVRDMLIEETKKRLKKLEGG